MPSRRPAMSTGTAVYLYGVVRDGDTLALDDVPPIGGDAGPVYMSRTAAWPRW